MARSTTRRALVGMWLAAFTMALPGCKPAKERAAEPGDAAARATLVVRAAKDSNGGRPLRALVRAVTRKGFVEDGYADVARLVVQPDETVIHTLIVFPGQIYVIPLEFEETPETVGVYGLFTRHTGESWKMLVERPLEIDLSVGESALEHVRVREVPARY